MNLNNLPIDVIIEVIIPHLSKKDVISAALTNKILYNDLLDDERVHHYFEKWACTKIINHPDSIGSARSINLNRICFVRNHTIQIFNIHPWEFLHKLEGHTDGISCVKWSNDGTNRICSGSSDKTVRVWNLDTGNCLILEGHTARLTDVCWSADGSNRIASASWDHSVRLWDSTTGQYLMTVFHRNNIPHCFTCICWIKNDSYNFICAGNCDKKVRLWNVDTGVKLVSGGYPFYLNNVYYDNNDDSNLLYTVSGGQANIGEYIRIINIKTGTDKVININDTKGGRIRFSDKKTNIFYYLKRKDICIHSIETNKCLQVLKGHTSNINFVSLTGPKRIFSGCYDNTLRVWDKVVPKKIK